MSANEERRLNDFSSGPESHSAASELRARGDTGSDGSLGLDPDLLKESVAVHEAAPPPRRRRHPWRIAAVVAGAAIVALLVAIAAVVPTGTSNST